MKPNWTPTTRRKCSSGSSSRRRSVRRFSSRSSVSRSDFRVCPSQIAAGRSVVAARKPRSEDGCDSHSLSRYGPLSMRKTRVSAIGVSLVAGAAFVFVLTAGVDAQRRRGNDNSAFGVPVATNTIVDAPDQYFGKLVTITAGVERMVSKTTFLMDQQKMAGPKDVKGVGKPILVIAPYLTSSLDQKKYFLVRGQVVKLEPSALAKLAPDYVLDLPQEVGTKYMGLPVIVASSVLNATYVELAKKPIPPPTQADVALTAAMKR